MLVIRLVVAVLAVASLLLPSAPPQSSEGATGWLQRAQTHFQNQDWQTAREAASKALELNPRLGDAETLLGLVAIANSQPELAEKHFIRAVSLQPDDHRAHAYLGSTYLQQKRFAEAHRSFQTVLRLRPGNLAAHYNLGLVALSLEDFAEAFNHFTFVHRAAPTDIPALIGVLETTLLLKRAQAMQETLDKLKALLTSRDPRLFHVASLLALHGNYDLAIPIFKNISQLSPDSYDVNYNLALAYVRSGRHDEAAQTLQLLVRQTERAEAYNLLGFVDGQRNRRVGATRALQKAAQLEPANEDYRFDYANELLQQEKIAAASAAFSTAANEFPSSWRMRLGLGAAYYLAGKYEEAAQALLDAVRIQPKANLAYYLLGKAYEPARSLQPNILAAFRAYLKEEPQDPWAYYHYSGMLYSQAGAKSEYELAKENLKQALTFDPSFAEAHLQLGVIAQSEGRYEESIVSLERATRLAPGLATAHYRLGLAYQKLGDREAAQAEFALFRKLKSAKQLERASVLRSLTRQRD